MPDGTGQGVEEVRRGQESGPPGRGRGPSPLYEAYRGHVILDALSEWTVIDRAPNVESGILHYRVLGGGDRSFGLRPRAIHPGILNDNASFFTGLRASIAEVGVKVPVLVYSINGRLYVRYGASRVHVAGQLGFKIVPAVLCHWHGPNGPLPLPSGFVFTGSLHTPIEVLTAFGPPAIVGDFEVSHEKIDAHRMEP